MINHEFNHDLIDPMATHALDTLRSLTRLSSLRVMTYGPFCGKHRTAPTARGTPGMIKRTVTRYPSRWVG